MSALTKPAQIILVIHIVLLLLALANRTRLPAITVWLRNKVTQAIYVLRVGGPWFLAGLLFRKACAPIMSFGSIIFFAGEIAYELQQTGAGKTNAGFSITYAAREDFPALIRGRSPALSYEKFTGRLASGDRCIIAVTPAGEIVHSRWITTRTRNIPEIGMDLVPGHEDIYFYDGYTWPDYRGRGIDGAVRSFIFQQLCERGLNRAISYVTGNNLVGLKAASRKQKCIGRLFYVRFGNTKPFVIWKSHLDGIQLVEAGRNDEEFANS